MPLPVTALFASLLGLWIVFLAFKVIGFRRGKQVSLGSAGDPAGEGLIRGHGNATETIPIFLIMLGLSEGMGSPSWVIYTLGAAFTLGRILHGLHFVAPRQGIQLRLYGMTLSLFPTIILAIELLRQAIGL